MSKDDTHSMDRRDILKAGLGAGAAAATMAVPGVSQANNHPNVHAGSMTELDRNTYIHNMELIAHYRFPRERPAGAGGGGDGEAAGFLPSAGKAQMMAIGRNRYLFQSGNIYDLTDPKKVSLVKAGAFRGGQIQVAYNKKIKKWILMSGSGAPTVSARPTGEDPNGKYDNPARVKEVLEWKGLRGVTFYDVTDVNNVKELSKFSCDQGDPNREVQEGAGTHRNFYSGGKYAYLDAGFDNGFTRMENPFRYWTNGIQLLDVEDPAKPKWVSNWWFPGQKDSEVEDYKKWRWAGDRVSWTCTHGPCVAPVNIEDGGKYGYTAYGHFGMSIHDLSDPRKPKLVGLFDPLALPGAIPFHTVDCGLEHLGLIITNAETLNPDCGEIYQDSYIIDVTDKTNPVGLSRLPRPVPPANAPYKDFCQKRGRTGTHNTPHVHAPGKASRNMTALAYFNAGIQVYDISNPRVPKITGYFIPPSGGDLSRPGSWNRDTDNILIEWDRNIIWAMTNSGIYCLSSPTLGKPSFEPAEVKEWVLPGINQGHHELKA